MMKRNFLAILLTAALSPSARAQLVTNGSFETPDAGGAFVGYGTGQVFGGWTVRDGSIDHIGLLWQAADGHQSVDMNGAGPGTIDQDIATEPGYAYTLRFALAGNPYGYDPKRLAVLWGGQQVADLTFDQTGTSPTDMHWGYHTLYLAANSATTRLAFQSLTGSMNGAQGFAPFYGPALDDVSLTLGPPRCQADLNTDGQVNVQDFLAFLQFYSAGDPRAEFLVDGQINVRDFLLFLQLYSQGC
jgi:choice-of-anchor C domain-containing protein